MIERKHFRATELQALGISRQVEEVRMWPRVVPMGWSWAVYLIQRFHEHVVGHIVPEGSWVLDKCAAQFVKPGVNLRIVH